MSTAEKVLIFEYWFRVLIGKDISIEAIVKIAVEFAAEYERFLSSLTYGDVSIENDGKVLISSMQTDCQAFGSAIASAGRKYHWKIKIIDSGFKSLNIGVIKSEVDVSLIGTEGGFWQNDDGCSYYAAGMLYQGGRCIELYAPPYGNDDVIDIWLDMRDENKHELLFLNQGQYTSSVQMSADYDYRFAMYIHKHYSQIEVMNFEIVS